MYKLDHFAFEVSNMDIAVDFYQNALGLKLLSRGVNKEVGEIFAFFKIGECTLELLCSTDPALQTSASPSALNCPHLAFQTDDMDGTLKMIRENGIHIVKGPLEIPGKEKWVYISDPDGNILEFIHWINPPA